MISKLAFETVDKFFKDLHKHDKPCGGVITVISGDFRQTLPIVRCGSKLHITENCVKKSYLREYFESISLKRYMRLEKRTLNLEIGNCEL